jgi:type IV secretion system protein VirB9
MEANGSVTLRFGDGLPQVVCAPLQVCDIELQRGETIRGANLGDAVRWEASPAVSGPEGAEVPHVVIKPKAREIGATSSLVVTTDRRTYHFSLNLSDTGYMPRVTFSYPDAEESAWALYHAQQVVTKAEAKKKHRKRAKVDGESSPIDFSYDIEGKAPWKPLRVYNDGKHTFIDFPGESFYADIPVLLSVATDGQQELVNYRVKGTQFKVDRVLSQAVLVSGVGSDQARVAISRREKDA